MTDLRTAAQQALEYMKSVGQTDMYPEEWAIVGRLEAALAQEQAEPLGCEHCNHPLYAATKCRVCGRVTEPRCQYPNCIGGQNGTVCNSWCPGAQT